jgi:hypothetical protein
VAKGVLDQSSSHRVGAAEPTLGSHTATDTTISAIVFVFFTFQPPCCHGAIDIDLSFRPILVRWLSSRLPSPDSIATMRQACQRSCPVFTSSACVRGNRAQVQRLQSSQAVPAILSVYDPEV